MLCYSQAIHFVWAFFCLACFHALPNQPSNVLHNESGILIGGVIFLQIKKLQSRSVEQLLEAILTLKNLEESYVFFDDLCTVNEIQSMAQRLEVARMLRMGSTYSQIEEETGASTATISRVKRCLNFGNDGYQLTLERLGR